MTLGLFLSILGLVCAHKGKRGLPHRMASQGNKLITARYYCQLMKPLMVSGSSTTKLAFQRRFLLH